MADPISGDLQRTQSIAPKQAISTSTPGQKGPITAPTPAASVVEDSSVTLSTQLAEDIATTGMDQQKVDQIKLSIEEGSYPLDNRKIAESFIPLEKLL